VHFNGSCTGLLSHCDVCQLSLLVVVYKGESNRSKGQGYLELGYWVGISCLDLINNPYIWGKNQGPLQSINECLPVSPIGKMNPTASTTEYNYPCELQTDASNYYPFVLFPKFIDHLLLTLILQHSPGSLSGYWDWRDYPLASQNNCYWNRFHLLLAQY